MHDDDQYEEDEPETSAKRRDSKIDAAKLLLMAELFIVGREEVFYGRQIETFVEKQFYHWITKKALNELAAEHKIIMNVEERSGIVAHMYHVKGYRYPRREIAEIIKLIGEFSDPGFTRALGTNGEMLADAAMARVGFRIRQSNVRAVSGVGWTESNHNLDRLIERDGIQYGVEIKNQLGYISRAELRTKLAMCEHFDIRPMFIARMMPKSYIYEVQQAGGFCLILENQHYPLLADELATRVRSRLRLPVRSIQQLPDRTFRRFERWHEGGHKPLRPQQLL